MTFRTKRAEREQARRLAERYRCPFVDLREQRIDPELFRSIPAEMMFRYNFVPLEAHDATLVVAMADPSQLQLTDELSLLLEQSACRSKSLPLRRSAIC